MREAAELLGGAVLLASIVHTAHQSRVAKKEACAAKEEARRVGGALDVVAILVKQPRAPSSEGR
jgi:hypothetical protein